MNKLTLSLAAIGSLSLLAMVPSSAQVIITEVDPSGSGNTNGYVQDWFELTNYGSSAVNINGWSMDDNSNSFGSSVPLTGVSSINPGQSVVFVEDTGGTASTIDAAFESAWFGTHVPSGFTIGNYGGSGVGLSQSGDAVNIFNASGVLQAGVQFGNSTNKVSFDNSVAKITNTGSSDGTISTNSVAGVNGAFVSPGGASETGSPGTVGAVPEPASGFLAVLVMSAFAACAWLHRKIARA